MRNYLAFWISLSLGAGLAACGDDDGKASCDPIANRGCVGGLVCEATTSGDSVCAAPVVLRGHVFALADGAPVADARVVALDVNGSPRSSVALTDATGAYELAVPHERNDDGTPVALRVTLRADAPGFQTFPSGIRQSLPLDTTAAALVDGVFVVESSVTDVGLIALPDGAGTGSISGTVALPESRPGVLVVAEKDGVGHSAIADREGHYRIFNLAPGTYSLSGYARGTSFESESVAVAADADAPADLARTNAPTSTVAGKVEIVNPGDGQATSVILAVESLFDEATLRGESPPGLRVGDVGGAFTIDGVPVGRYVILAAFENDFLIRDPDTSIGGTQIVHLDVTAGGDVVIDESFKITGALNFFAPLGLVPFAATAAPIITWEDDSSEDGYELTVYDALGHQVWSAWEDGHSGSTPAVPYGGPLDHGMYYQVKIRSMKDGTPISTTEDLAGVFFVE